MTIRGSGETLLGLGFALLASAAFIRDPAASDANIGAGILILVGIPVGLLGLLLTSAEAVFRARRRQPDTRAMAGHRTEQLFK